MEPIVVRFNPACDEKEIELVEKIRNYYNSANAIEELINNASNDSALSVLVDKYTEAKNNVDKYMNELNRTILENVVTPEDFDFNTNVNFLMGSITLAPLNEAGENTANAIALKYSSKL